MPDVNSISAKVDALVQLVEALRAERDSLNAQVADLTARAVAAEAAAVDPTVVNLIDQKLDAAISSLAPAQ